MKKTTNDEFLRYFNNRLMRSDNLDNLFEKLEGLQIMYNLDDRQDQILTTLRKLIEEKTK